MLEQSAIISSDIFALQIAGGEVISALRDKCYKLAEAYWEEGCNDKKAAAYLLADKYQAVLEALNVLDGAATAIRRDSPGLPHSDPWGDAL